MPLSVPSAYRPRASACPGLFRIVPARDGGICRVKIPLGQLRGAQGRALADAARRFGNGIIDVTNRANLQLRGIASAGAEAVADALMKADLGPDQPEADDIRNVMVSPTAGIDPAQLRDMRPLAQALLDRIQADPACRTLSPKFCFLIDGGEEIAVIDHPHDVWLCSLDEARMAIGFAGCPSDEPAGTIYYEDAVEIIIAAARLFQEAAAGNPAITRLRHLFAAHPRAAFINRLGGLEQAPQWRRPRRRRNPLGIHSQRGAGLSYVGAIPPLGRLTPAMLTGVADIAGRYGEDEIRLTPWQGLLVPSVPDKDAETVQDTLERLGFICDSLNPMASMIACAGSPGCSSGRSDTKSDAQALAGMIPGGTGIVHLSGCEKSCASAAAADTTLVGVAPGRYDLYARSEQGESRFGRAVARSVSLDRAARFLRDGT